MGDKIVKSPNIRFTGFTEAWKQHKWVDTVDISTNMVDPRNGIYDDLYHIGPGNIESFTGRILDNVNTVKEDNLISGKFHFNKGDVIYGKINPQLGKYVYAPYEGLTSADAYVLNSKNGLHQTFLFTVLQTQHFFKYSVSVSMRSGMPKINRNELNEYSFMAPSEVEQEQIGKLFLKLDNNITLHQCKLDLLKVTKKSMLQKMFTKDGANVPEIRFAGFTDEWEQRKLSEVSIFIDGNYGEKYPRDSEFIEYGVPFFTSAVIGTSGIFNERLIKYISNEKNNTLLKAQSIGGDIILTNRGASMGVTAQIPLKYGIVNIGPQLTRIRGNENIADNLFLLSMFKHPKHIRKLTSMNAGSAMPFIGLAGLGKFEFLLPKYEEQQRIGEYFQKLDNLITLHQRELDLLKDFKKSMLKQMFI